MRVGGLFRGLTEPVLAAAMATAFAAACSPSETGVTQAQTGDPVIVLSEGPCDDTCPVYDMTLRPDGSYILNAERFVRTTGVLEGGLGSDAWTAAEEVLGDADFWEIDAVQTADTLMTCQPGAPTVQVTWRTMEGKEKTVAYNAGCGVRSMNTLIAALREALHFDDLVWTNARFNPETGER